VEVGQHGTLNSDLLYELIGSIARDPIYTIDGDGTITSYIEIVVADTGVGIANSFLPYVIDRFRQALQQCHPRPARLGPGTAPLLCMCTENGDGEHNSRGCSSGR
jgi:hypothetical protein